MKFTVVRCTDVEKYQKKYNMLERFGIQMNKYHPKVQAKAKFLL